MKPRNKLSVLLAEISRTIGYDIIGEDFDDFLESAKKLTEDQAIHLLAAYKNTGTRELGRNQNSCVYLIRFLVALFPRSLPLIESWLSQFEKREDYQVHFTLFCYLSQIPDFGSASDIAEVLRIMENYLLQVKADTGHASWMAGDMLSDHWDTAESLPVLLRAARNARFLSGRSTALGGLEVLLTGNSYGLVSKSPVESKLSTEEKTIVRRVLRAIVRKECNSGIRSEAERLLRSME